VLDKLQVNPDNPRFIRGDAFGKLVNSIRDFPDMLAKRPIVYDENNIILGGNMRYMALKELVKEGFEVKDEYFKQVTDWTEEQKREFVIKDNVALGEWDTDILANKWDDLPLEDWGIDTVGWDNEEVEEDEVPELSEEAVSKLDEVYLLGRHHLMCGDSTKKEDVEKLMDGNKAELLFTSPPYADMRDYGGGKELSIEHLATFIPTWRMFVDYQVVNLGIQRKDGEINQYWDEYIKSAKDSGLKLLSWNIWNRDNATSIGMQSAMFPIFHEWIFVFGDNPKEINRTEQLSEATKERMKYKPGTRRQKDGSLKRVREYSVYDKTKIGTVITMKAANTIGESHPAMFPVQLPAEYIKVMTDENAIVVDVFGGSGSTLIACEQLDRTCYIMEIDPRYIDVIRKRYAKFIGKEEEWEKITPAIE